MAVFWKNHLKDVDFSENALKEVPPGLFQLDVSPVAPGALESRFCVKISPHCREVCTLLLSSRDQKKKKKKVEKKVQLPKKCAKIDRKYAK